MELFLIILGAVLLSVVMVFVFPPPTDGQTYKTVSEDYEGSLVRIHYGWELGTSTVICPIHEVKDYTEKFTVLSIEEYKGE